MLTANLRGNSWLVNNLHSIISNRFKSTLYGYCLMYNSSEQINSQGRARLSITFGKCIFSFTMLNDSSAKWIRRNFWMERRYARLQRSLPTPRNGNVHTWPLSLPQFKIDANNFSPKCSTDIFRRSGEFIYSQILKKKYAGLSNSVPFLSTKSLKWSSECSLLGISPNAKGCLSLKRLLLSQ